MSGLCLCQEQRHEQSQDLRAPEDYGCVLKLTHEVLKPYAGTIDIGKFMCIEDMSLARFFPELIGEILRNRPRRQMMDLHSAQEIKSADRWIVGKLSFHLANAIQYRRFAGSARPRINVVRWWLGETPCVEVMARKGFRDL